MTLSLALKSLKAKPLRTVASVLAVAVAVAMFFCMFSFESAVYRYVFEVETADFGDSDIMITAKSGGDRIALVQPLYDVEGVESVTPTVSVYALTAFGDEEDEEYLRLRGFDEGGIAGLDFGRKAGQFLCRRHRRKQGTFRRRFAIYRAREHVEGVLAHHRGHRL